MNNTLSKHLESVTEESMESWLKDQFYIYASSHSESKGKISLGIDGMGKFCTKCNRDGVIIHPNLKEAVGHYKSLLLETEDDFGTIATCSKEHQQCLRCIYDKEPMSCKACQHCLKHLKANEYYIK